MVIAQEECRADKVCCICTCSCQCHGCTSRQCMVLYESARTHFFKFSKCWSVNLTLETHWIWRTVALAVGLGLQESWIQISTCSCRGSSKSVPLALRTGWRMGVALDSNWEGCKFRSAYSCTCTWNGLHFRVILQVLVPVEEFTMMCFKCRASDVWLLPFCCLEPCWSGGPLECFAIDISPERGLKNKK